MECKFNIFDTIHIFKYQQFTIISAIGEYESRFQYKLNILYIKKVWYR